jgi:hypothetical protein
MSLAGPQATPFGNGLARPYRSAAPDILDWLYDTVTARVTERQLAIVVHDGSWLAGATEVKNDTVVFGWSGFVPGYQFPSRSMSEELGGGDVTAKAVQVGLGPSIEETLSVACASMTLSGSVHRSDVSAARRKAYGAIEQIGGLIAPPWLGGNVQKATLAASSRLSQVQQRRGLLAIVAFSIECVVFAQQ